MLHRFCLTIAAAALVAGCNGEAADGAESPTPAPVATPSTDDTAAATLSGARAVSEETDDFLFEYSYPAEAGNIPELARVLDRRLDNTRRELARMSAEAREEAADDGFPYNKYSNNVEWQVVADTPRFLSLSADVSNYWGGAHGNYGMNSLVWDKRAEQSLAPLDMFASTDAFDAAVREAFCEGLDVERSRRRAGGPIVDDGTSFTQCPGLDELTLLVGSGGGDALDRLTLYAGPYVAGAYAEGDFQIDLPVTPEVIAALKPEYRDAFAARNPGE